MIEKSFNIIGLGEILWDCLPTEKHLGGAPANFAYIAKQLGNNGIVCSRIGNDQPGTEILEQIKAKNLSADYIQIDEKKQTGIVNIKLKKGQPSYEIVQNVAWDFLELNDHWKDLAKKSDAVCFGTLAQRNSASRKTILEFVKLTNGLKVFDANLRQNFYAADILCESLILANVCKLNHEELPIIAGMLEVKGATLLKIAENLLLKFNLDLVCLTLGAKGSLLVNKKAVSNFGGIKVKIVDTIGAGDSFTAAMTHGILNGWELDKINIFANQVGAYVASKKGAMPDFSKFKV